MTTARATSSDMILFTPGSGTNPSSTQCNSVATQLYKTGYKWIYGRKKAYAVYNASSEDAYIDTEAFKRLVIKRLDEFALQYSEWYSDSNKEPPLGDFTEEYRYDMVSVKSISTRQASYEDTPLDQVGDGVN